MLKIYIEKNLANNFIRQSKFLAGAPILFVWKLDGIFYLCVNYCGLNNLTIKNQYLLPLIGELLNQLDQTKNFIQLDLTNVYYLMRIKESNKYKTVFKT